ncbi:VOC family protein [Deinococcus sp. QL22]|uniref:VOC family protein n=1 Tax=Deinococcus sp. QL22 TaxID=2939437 RepID=UPI002017D93B|nr:VOC family protein [Deinococcus sp. QL22]UQN05083.1 VOC family protein [Deinococcus sp. QL22]
MIASFSILPPQTHTGAVTLRVRDLPGLTEFYSTLLGLTRLAESQNQVTLGAHGTPLLHLEGDPSLPLAPVSRPGLYHTAFLLPTRADLGRWLRHAAGLNASGSGLRLGTGDHLVSEAIYLNDPEGNGIEVYRDRNRDAWTWQDGQVQMDTKAVDVEDLLAAAGDTVFDGAPAGTAVGHVHLKVGSAAQAAQFYAHTLGLDVVADMGSAAFLSWGGYHHHIGLNEWHSRGQGAPSTPAAGLGGVEILTPDLSGLRTHLSGQDGVQDSGDSLTLHDPWGNRLTVREVAQK